MTPAFPPAFCLFFRTNAINSGVVGAGPYGFFLLPFLRPWRRDGLGIERVRGFVAQRHYILHDSLVRACIYAVLCVVVSFILLFSFYLS